VPAEAGQPLAGSYLFGDSPAFALRIGGVTLLIQVADGHLRDLMRLHWGAFETSLEEASEVDAVFRFCDTASSGLRKLRRSHSLISRNLVVLSDGKRYLMTCCLYGRPWQFDCRSLPSWDPAFIHFYVFEPALLDVLKTLGVLVWHSGAVERNGRAILLPGASGRGKSTTTMNLLSLGYRFIADDTVVLRKRKRSVEVTGRETSVYLTSNSLRLLPAWEDFVSPSRVRKGRRWKSRIDVSSFRSNRATPARVKCLLFPLITKRRKSVLEKLSTGQALLECLRQEPKEFPASVLGPAALDAQFDLYSTITEASEAYRIHLGSDQDSVRNALRTLLQS
jgi:hypothetical protein